MTDAQRCKLSIEAQKRALEEQRRTIDRLRSERAFLLLTLAAILFVAVICVAARADTARRTIRQSGVATWFGTGG